MESKINIYMLVYTDCPINGHLYIDTSTFNEKSFIF